MKRIIGILVAALAAGFYLGTPAYATYGGDDPGWAACKNLASWSVNEDEGDRRPEPTVYGLKFSGDDLIHHAADVKLTDLKPGSYTVTGASPDQDSFFSVEVRDTTTGAYGTLRWNKGTSKWDLVTSTAAYAKADPADYVGVQTKWGEITAAAKVVSFGVGYTKNPPGTVTVVVSSVTFQGTTYGLNCPAPVTTSPTASPSATKTATTSPSATTTSSVASATKNPAASTSGGVVPGPSLPVTGPSTGLLIAVGVLSLGAGITFMTLAFRRRKVNFTA